ncbi:MAG: hypothetical protein CVV32_08200 [Methanomicrobiales archaeon HGW-Methanomicrobiales-3]|nr:MAG: hypothetical protein CVV32_08200 [Methanomicrobiales archaeon HGW-Methanomicrobiales-3]
MLAFEEMEVRIDNDLLPSGDLICTDCGSDWSVGDLIRIDLSSDPRYEFTMPNKVDIIYKKGDQFQQILTTRYLGTMTPTLTPVTITGTSTVTPTATPVPAPVAGFNGAPLSGIRPLSVSFADTSTNFPEFWLWDFGDGNTTGNTLQHPEHLYTTAGNYTVTLTATNSGGSNTLVRADYIRVKQSFSDFITNENVGVFGTKFYFEGSRVIGPDATIFIAGPLVTSDLNGGSELLVHRIYVDGDLTLDGGSAGLGSPTNPGNIYVNGNLKLWSGGRDIYGDVYVAGNFELKDAKIHNIVYVDGDLTLGWTPTLDANARIYYTGNFIYPNGMSTAITDKCIKQASVPGFLIPDPVIPQAKPAAWYADRGYVAGGPLTNNKKIIAESYSSTGGPSASNVIVVARTGDISLTGYGGSTITGVLFAPNGRVTFAGKAFEGVVVAKDGFYVTSGGTTVTFKKLNDYFSSADDYPF